MGFGIGKLSYKPYAKKRVKTRRKKRRNLLNHLLRRGNQNYIDRQLFCAFVSAF